MTTGGIENEDTGKPGHCLHCGVHYGLLHHSYCPESGWRKTDADLHIDIVPEGWPMHGRDSDELVTETGKPLVCGPQGERPDTQEVNVLCAAWNDLSTQAKQDLLRCKPGSIIRCTKEDLDLLKWNTVTVVQHNEKLEKRVAELERLVEDMKLREPDPS